MSSFTPSYYLERAAECEASAAQASDLARRENYLELAQGFRQMANKISVPHMESDADAIRLAERIIGHKAE
jgi:hypothetical protein